MVLLTLTTSALLIGWFAHQFWIRNRLATFQAENARLNHVLTDRLGAPLADWDQQVARVRRSL